LFLKNRLKPPKLSEFLSSSGQRDKKPDSRILGMLMDNTHETRTLQAKV